MENNKPLTRAGYLVAFMLIVIPIIDAFAAMWPLHLSDERWRFGAFGILSNALLVPVFGFLVAVALATMLGHRHVRRVIGWLCAVGAVVTAALAVLFILDFFQTRTIVRPPFRHPMAIAASVALVKQTLIIIALALLSRAGFTELKMLSRRRSSVIAEPDSTPLIPTGGTIRPG